MHPLYERASAVVDELGTARMQVVGLAADLAEAEYDLRVSKDKVERVLIKKVGGERALAPTAEDRARMLTLAVDTDPEYRRLLNRREELQTSLDKAKAKAASVRDRLSLMPAAMRSAPADL